MKKVRIIKPKTHGETYMRTYGVSQIRLTKALSELMDIRKGKFVKFGIDDDDDLVCMVFDKEDEETYPVGCITPNKNKKQVYYYINARTIVDYMNDITLPKDKSQIFIVTLKEDNVFKLTRKIV